MSNKRLAAFCEVLDTMADWMEEAGAPVGDMEREALASARACVASPTDRSKGRTYTAWAVLNAAATTSPATTPTRDFRDAILLVCRGALSSEAELTAESLAFAERVLLTHATNAGAALGVRGAAQAARVALDAGKRDGRKPSRFPEPGFAKQLCLGSVLRRVRVHGRMEPADVCAAVERSGGPKLTPRGLALIEGGNPGRGAPVDAVAEALGRSPDDVRARGAMAHALASEFALRAGVADPERWFAEVVSVDGEEVARAYVLAASAAAVRVDPAKLRRPAGE